MKSTSNGQPLVIILMSTYNGEQYIEEQLESIYSQTYQNWKLFVRDDGSKDSTVDILKKFQKRGNLILNQGENLGFVKSFFWLLNNAPDADYYSFADQDDKWLDFKIERAVELLEKNKNGEPLLYFSDFDYCDADLNFIEHRTSKKNRLNFVEAIADGNRVIGFSCVVTKSFKDLLAKAKPENIFSHDHFMYLLSFVIGSQIYDRISTTKYRRHGKNASQSRSEFFTLLTWRIKNFVLSENDRFRKMYNEILTCYPEFLDKHKYNLLSAFVNDYNSFRNRMYKFFYPRRFRQYLVDEIPLRILFLMGKM